MREMVAEQALNAKRKPWMRLAGAGLELATTVVAFGTVGWMTDHLVGTRPLTMTLLGSVGFIFAMYRFIRLAVRVSEEQRGIEERQRNLKRQNDPVIERNVDEDS